VTDTTALYDALLQRIEAGQPLPAEEIRQLAAAPDILPLGMLADTLRRRIHDNQVTYLRVASCAFDASFVNAVPPTAGEVRITGQPPALEVAATAVEAAKAVAGERAVSGFAWADVERLAAAGGDTVARVLARLRDAGLDAFVEVPLDREGGADDAVEQLAAAGFRQVRLTIEKAAAADRTQLLMGAAALQDRYACIQAINPLPTAMQTFRPTTGYEDVKMVALARLAAPNIPTIQVDWLRYGPKLAQVALTFGANDLDGVTASDDAPDGRRRAPIEEVRRNIEAAGFRPAERDGHYGLVT
jgi:2-iminoacetate synthase ThiH